MVGFGAEELHRPRHAAVLAARAAPTSTSARQARAAGGGGRAAAQAREGFETVFMRKNGERFPV